MTPGSNGRLPNPFGWGGGTVFLVIAVLAVNVFGIWEIAVALRGVREQRQAALQQETLARAQSIEIRLATISAELSFLAGSKPMRWDDEGIQDRAWRDEAGAALLLVLRGHLQIDQLSLMDADGVPLVRAGRPRGVPGFWIPDGEVRSPQPTDDRIWLRRFSLHEPAQDRLPASLEAIVTPSALSLDASIGEADEAQLRCIISSDDSEPASGSSVEIANPQAQTALDIGPWSSTPNWELVCTAEASWRPAILEPLVVRQRRVVAVNLAAMALVVLLGALAHRQSVRRRAIEARVAEEGRVRELERQLFHAERLRTVGRLAAGVAHELNNPLEGVANYLHLAKASLERGDVDSARRQLGDVDHGLDRVTGILRRVLDHSDPATAPHRQIDVAQALTDAVEFVRGRSEFAEVRLAPTVVDGDTSAIGSSVLLGQLFLNLIINACEAQPDGGDVETRCAQIDDRIVCEVSDRGMGVQPERRERIFEPFESSKRSAGLGLSICHTIAQQHGGELACFDRPGGGTVFRLTIPSAKGAAAQESGDEG